MRRLSCKEVYCEYCRAAEHLEGVCGDSRARRYTANIVGQQSIRKGVCGDSRARRYIANIVRQQSIWKGYAETLVQKGILRIL